MTEKRERTDEEKRRESEVCWLGRTGHAWSASTHARACAIAARESERARVSYSVRRKHPDGSPALFLAHPTSDHGWGEMGGLTDVFEHGVRRPAPEPYFGPQLLDRVVRRDKAQHSLRAWVQRARSRCAFSAVVVAEFCRFRLGLTYQETIALVRTEWPELDSATWDDLMEEAEEAEEGR